MSYLQIEHMHFAYPDGFVALRDVSLEAKEGEFVCIVGPSGCGKSTLLDVIDGLAPVRSGRVTIDGVPVTKPGPDRAVVFQSANLLPWRTVAGNVAFALECTRSPELRRESRAARKQRIERLIRLVGLAGFENFYPGALSGGMRQRVNLARALALEPETLLMDEPFGSLDAQTRDMMQVELLRIWQETRGTVLFVTHSIDEAVFLADKVIVISGRPGTVKRVVNVDLPRPRDSSIRRTPEFAAYEEMIAREIYNEVEAA